MSKPLAYPPPWQDVSTLSAHLCISESTIDNWVLAGILPPPRKRGGKRMWKWAEVDAMIDQGTSTSSDPEADRIRDATKAALAPHQG
jgi:predicted DNA-binding transcriptional regulator AlpA